MDTAVLSTPWLHSIPIYTKQIHIMCCIYVPLKRDGAGRFTGGLWRQWGRDSLAKGMARPNNDAVLAYAGGIHWLASGDGRTTDGGDGAVCGGGAANVNDDEILSVCFLCENVYQRWCTFRSVCDVTSFSSHATRPLRAEPNLRWLRGRIIKYESNISAYYNGFCL